MAEAIEDKFIGIGEFEYQDGNELNIYFCNNWIEGSSWDEMEIKYCPFCSKEIDFLIEI